MGTVVRNKSKRKTKKPKEIPLGQLPDMSNDPVVVKKVEQAKRMLEKYGIPK
jgi:hypothetical protein